MAVQGRWTKYHENLLKKWAQMCKTYSIMHSLSAAHYSKWDKRLGIPVVILGAGTSASILSGQDSNGVMKYVNGTLVMIVSALAGLTKFLGTAEKTTKHQNASFKYTSIGLNIDTILSFPRAERSVGPQAFISDIKTNILEVREHAPEVLTSIMNDYLRKYDKTLTNVKSRADKKIYGTGQLENPYGYGTSSGPTEYNSGGSSDKDEQLPESKQRSLTSENEDVQTATLHQSHIVDFIDKSSVAMADAGVKLGFQTDGEFSDSDEGV